MPDLITQPTCEALRRVLGGTYTVSVGDEVTVVFAPLPQSCPAAAVRVHGHLWVVLDLDKPLALRHARAMINDYREQKAARVDLGDDDLNRDWQMQHSMVPIPNPRTDEPLRVMPVGLTPLAQLVITGAGAAVATISALFNGVSAGGLV